MIKALTAFIVSFVLCVVAMPVIIKFIKKKNASQTILNYVENHKDKNGTPTMGGVVFLIFTPIIAFIFLRYNTEWFMCLLTSLFFGLIGFMDDFIKIKYKQNLGLRPYQKVVGQLGLSLIFAVFIYFFTNQKGNIFLPFSSNLVNIGFWVVPLIVIVLISTTNSVNLTDGLDGLASGVSFVYLLFFSVISAVVYSQIYQTGYTGKLLDNLTNIIVINAIFMGLILGFLVFNTSKAKIFMGDVGSLCLGGYIGTSCCLLGLEFVLPMLGFCFVFSAISVIMQVIYFKATKKRIFKMAPFHHHLQMSGLTEPQIVNIYSTATMLIGGLMLILYLM